MDAQHLADCKRKRDAFLSEKKAFETKQAEQKSADDALYEQLLTESNQYLKTKVGADLEYMRTQGVDVSIRESSVWGRGKDIIVDYWWVGNDRSHHHASFKIPKSEVIK